MVIKEFFTQEYDNIFRFHRSGAGGLDVASELTQLVDATLSKLWNELPEPSREAFAVVALGGYGRCEMAPHSDVDVMVLFENEQAKVANAETAQKFLHSLWNLGFDVGHSVRTINDCLNLYQTDVDVWASVLESRYVCGSSTVMNDYTDAFIDAVKKKDDRKFVSAVIAGVDDRHKKYEHSVKLLEPNLKNSAGGIRDLHSLVWIYRSTDASFFTNTPFHHNGSGCIALFRQLLNNWSISVEEHEECVRAFDGILRLRNELHYFSGTQNDIMEFSKQLEIAQALGYKRPSPVESVEQCMREYFLHARTLYRLNKRLINLFRSNSTSTFWSLRREEVLDDLYKIKERQLALRDARAPLKSPADVAKGFFWCGFHSIELNPVLHAQFQSLSRDQTFFRTDDNATAKAFLDILRLPSNVAVTLQMMNENDILGSLIPEWGNLVAFFQHSVYHYYTTDAHTLIALEHAEQLQQSDNILGRAFRSLSHREILYLAIIFHDIAKPIGVQGHEITGVDIWKLVQLRFGFPDEDDDVAFLIRNHLAMEQVAFRRNIDDPATIKEFASMFARPEQLDLLFVLTYSDLSAVNKNVWSQWKEMLLQDLYMRTRRFLTATEEGTIAATSSPYTSEEYSKFETDVATLDTVSVLYKHEDAHSIVTVITRDAEFLLSTVCGVLAANDANIFDAQIYTRPDGIVIDTFRLVDAATKLPLTKDQEISIAEDLKNVLLKSITLESLFARYHRRWRRRAKPLFHPNVRIDTVFHESGKHTIIDVYAPDMTGFLYKITEIFSRNGLQIDLAKLATRGDGIVDAFYVTKNGKPISSEAEKQYLRGEILHTINQLMAVQLEI
ncbi:MAG: HD domain-containing protein [Bacteroidetes bacterium]|nr:HD domain-containing protein [Bacteroidota bacterium]